MTMLFIGAPSSGPSSMILQIEEVGSDTDTGGENPNVAPLINSVLD